MKKFLITVQERQDTQYCVSAQTHEDARELLSRGIWDDITYSEFVDISNEPEDWVIEELRNNTVLRDKIV